MDTTQTRHSGPSAVEIEAQIRWEVEGVNRGVRRYREENAKLQIGATPPGKTAIREVLKGMVKAVEDAQNEVVLRNKRGHVPPWSVPFLMLDADVLAFLTVNELLNARSRDRAGPSLTSVAMSIANACVKQIEFQTWLEREHAIHKEARKRGAPRQSMIERLKREVPKIDAMWWGKWSRRVLKLERVKWSEGLRIAVGTKLIHLAVEHGRGWFEVVRARRPQNREVFTVQLTDDAKGFLADLDERASVALPINLPMIIPPLSWRWEN